jgi:hypothetical protein
MRKAKRSKKKARKPKKRVAKRATKRSAKRKKSKTGKSKTGKSRSARSVTRRQKEPIPAEPAGRIGIRRPSNQPKPPGRSEPRELAQAEPDARFGDLRQPEDNARDPAATERETGRDRGYKNTDEGF